MIITIKRNTRLRPKEGREGVIAVGVVVLVTRFKGRVLSCGTSQERLTRFGNSAAASVAQCSDPKHDEPLQMENIREVTPS